MPDIVGGRYAKKISQELNLKLHLLERRVYPDSEVCPRVQVQGELSDTIYFVLRPKKNQNLNAYLTEYLFTLKNLNEKVSNIFAFMPYFVYARQDKAFREGEPFSSKYIAELIEQCGATTFTTINVHGHRQKLDNLFSIHSQNLSAISLLAEYAKQRFQFEKPIILGPDDEAVTWAKEFADILGVDRYDAVHKERDLETGEIETVLPSITFEDRDIIVVDDIIATGNTMVSTMRKTKKRGANSISAFVVHPVLVKNALEKLKRLKPNAIIATNTLASPISKVDAREAIIENIKASL